MNEMHSMPSRAKRMSLRAKNAASLKVIHQSLTSLLFIVTPSLASGGFKTEEGFERATSQSGWALVHLYAFFRCTHWAGALKVCRP